MLSVPGIGNPTDTFFLTSQVSAAGVASVFTQVNAVAGQTNTAVAEYQAGGLTISSNGTTHIAFIDNGTPLVLTTPGRPTDLVQMRPDLYVVAFQNSTTNNVSLQAVLVAPNGDLALGGTVIAGSGGSGIGTAGQNVYDADIIRLDDDRVLVVYVSDGGDSFANPVNQSITDGVYASVYSLTTGAILSDTLLGNFGSTSNEAILQAIDVSASMLADGRVVVSHSAPGNGNTLWGTDVVADILDLRVKGITVSGTASADQFQGTAFADTFNDVGAGDFIAGGNGNDTVVFSGATARVVDLANPDAVVESTFVLSGVENLTGGTGNDVFFGDSLNNRLAGGVGNDALSGRAGSDRLSGDNGLDTLFGGAGFDTLTGGAHDDNLFGGADNDLLQGGIGNDLVRAGDGADGVYGNEGDDRLYGDAGADQIEGGSGNDLIFGGADADFMSGGVGNDTLRGGDAGDSLLGGDGADVLIARAEVDAVDGGAGTDTLILVRTPSPTPTVGMFADLSGAFFTFGPARDYEVFDAVISQIENLTGTGDDDELVGSAAANVLRGGGGSDVLVGLGGSDTLSGGGGADMFVFLTASADNDRITGFEIGSDKLLLSAGAFGDLSTVALSTRLTINASATVAANASAQVIFDNAGAGAGRLFFDIDGNGGGAAVLLATLDFSTAGGVAAFSASDFVFI
jgi:Ca2+-binding RTX toxin-like protein